MSRPSLTSARHAGCGLAFGLCLLLSSAPAPGAETRHAPHPPSEEEARSVSESMDARLSHLAWLAGSWQGEIRGAGKTVSYEAYYSTPAGGVILSINKAFQSDGNLSWIELERFEVRDGHLQVTPYPDGMPSVPFRLVELDLEGRRAVFANPEHDYPTRITYHRVEDGRLIVTVEGDTEGAPVMEFRLSSVEP